MCVRVPPRLGEGEDLTGDAGAPVLTQPRRVGGGTFRCSWAEVFGSGGRERLRQPANVVDEISEGVLLAGGRRRELIVGHSGQQARQLAGCGAEVNRGHR